jgi:epoxyqueuosine reductase
MTDTEFQARFCDNQIGRRERNAIRRNAIVAAGNSQSEALIPLLRTCAADPEAVIRQNSIWAISRIKGPAARPELEEALKAEEDAGVRTEIKTQLDGFGGAQ